MGNSGNFDFGGRFDYCLTMRGGQPEVLRDIFIGVTGNQITALEPFQKTFQDKSKSWFDGSGKVVMPGLVNAHTHIPMTLMRGLAEDQSFQKWLYETIWPLEAELVDVDFVKTGTELGLLESIRYGTTCIGDMYFFQEVVCEVMERAGLRGRMGLALIDFPTPDNKLVDGSSFVRLEKLIEKYQSHPRIQMAIGAHAPYSCGDETLKKAVALSNQTNVPIHIHVAETAHEMKEALEKYKKSTFNRLDELGVLKKGTIIAHGVHVTDEEIELLAMRGVSVIYNPESNMKLGSGCAPIPKYIQKGVVLGMGTDGAGSNNDQNLFGEMDTGAKLQKLFLSNNTAMSAAQCLKLATLGGATALGFGSLSGSLEVGKRADMIALDLNHPNLQPVHDVVSLLVYAANGSEVCLNMCDGKILYENGEFKTLNADKIYLEAKKYKDKIQNFLNERRTKNEK